METRSPSRRTVRSILSMRSEECRDCWSRR
jgi:hypothetical protein